MLQTITGIGIIFDILICSLFAARLTSSYKEDKTNLFLKYFVWFFWIFDLFFVVTAFYIPDLIISRESFFITIAFGLGFLVLYLVSAIAARIVALVNFPNFDNRLIFWPTVTLGVLVSALIILTGGPFIVLVQGKYMLQFTTTQTILMSVPVASSFLAASYTFVSQAIKDKKNRLRSLLLALSFLFWIVGGATHPLSLNAYTAMISDLTTSFGFVTAFIALIKTPK